jgi:hypothetical protein
MYQRPRRTLYSLCVWGHLECLAQGTVFLPREDDRGVLTADEKREDI